MNEWASLDVISQLPLSYRAWAWWLRHGLRGGNKLFSLLSQITRVSASDHYRTLTAKSRPALTIDLLDFESFHHTLAIWRNLDSVAKVILSLIQDGQVFIDVGANHGVYSLLVSSRIKASVYAIEPQPQLAEAIRRSVARNALANITVIESALSDQQGTKALFLPDRGSGAATMVRERAEARRDKISIAVSVTTLDALHEAIGSMHVLKIDVEGAEAEVIKGGLDAIRDARPFIIFERSSLEPQQEVFTLLESAGYYSFYDCAALASGELSGPRDDLELSNIVSVPRDKESLFKDRIGQLTAP